MKKRIALFFAVLLLAFSMPISAFAHGDITRAIPAADSQILSLPSEVSIEFDGKLQTLGDSKVNSITVTDNQGQVISNPVSVVDGTKISNRLQLTDVTGLVSVHYRIVSEDGHPVEGDYSFNVGSEPVIPTSAQEDAAEAANGISEESGSNLLIIGGTALVVIALLVALLKRRKK